MKPVRGGFWILDGHALLYRAFHAIQELSTAGGVPTNALFGFVRILTRIRDEYQPEAWTVAMDSHAPTFRHAESADYKATRKPMPDTLRPQVSMLRDFLAAARIPCLLQDGYEADDLIATVVAKFRGTLPLVIVSSDKDLHQLVGDDGVSIFAFKTGISEAEWRDPAAVTAKFGVPPAQVRDLLALTGDGSDNVKGVPGIGPKTASALLQQFGDIDTLYTRLEEAGTPARVKALREARDVVQQAVRLVTLRTDATVPAALADYARQQPDTARLREFLATYELVTLSGKWLEGEVTATTAAPPAAVMPAGELSLTHLPALLYLHATADGWHLSDGHGTALLADAPARSDWQRWWAQPGHTLVGDGLKDIWQACYHLGRGPALYDVRLAAYVRDPDDGTRPLATLAAHVLGHPVAEPETPAATLALLAELHTALRAADLPAAVLELETALIPVLGAMELAGVRVDRVCLEQLRDRYRAELDSIAATIAGLAGSTINLNSPKQLATLLFETLGLKAGKKTGKKTAYSTDNSVLEALYDAHPVIPLIIRHRHLAKLLATYVEGLLTAADSGGIIATTFNQTATATGRLSSSEPNLQNLPIRAEEDLDIRAAFLPDEPDRVLLCADYSQIELRVLAHLAQEEALIAAFRAGEDIHTATAAAVHGVPAGQVTREQRRQAKVINFGLLYGMTEFRLARDLGLPRAEAKAFIAAYFARYPQLRAWLDATIAQVRAQGRVETLLGRRRYFRGLESGTRLAQQAQERAAVNMPVQGTAADIIKLAMRAVQPLQAAHGAILVLQIHDELVFTVGRDEAPAFATALKPVMEQVLPLAVPLVVDLRRGSNLRDLAH